MIEVIHDGWMALRNSLVGCLIIYEPAAVFLCDLFGLLLQRLKITVVLPAVDLLIEVVKDPGTSQRYNP